MLLEIRLPETCRFPRLCEVLSLGKYWVSAFTSAWTLHNRARGRACDQYCSWRHLESVNASAIGPKVYPPQNHLERVMINRLFFWGYRICLFVCLFVSCTYRFIICPIWDSQQKLISSAGSSQKALKWAAFKSIFHSFTYTGWSRTGFPVKSIKCGNPR